MITGTIAPRPKRAITIGKYTLTLANDVPVEWTMDDADHIFFASKAGPGNMTFYQYEPPGVDLQMSATEDLETQYGITNPRYAYKVILPPGEKF